MPEPDVAILDRAGFGRRAELSTRLALVVIDVQYRTVGHDRVPISTAIGEYPTACGNRGWSAIDVIARLIRQARASEVPILFPCVAPKTAATAGQFRAKSPSLASPDPEAYRFVEEVKPQADDLIVPKDFPSAFFASALLTHLVERGIDSLLMTGCTTSGCVRATAVDAFSNGFRVAVVADGVYDRTDLVHQVSLFDIDSKYGNVIDSAAAVELLAR